MSLRRSTLAFLSAAVLALVAVSAALWWMMRETPPQYQGANVLLVSVDTLRADRLGAYGYREAETPRLDRLAREGIRFQQVVSPMPLTLPAHTSLMTALPTSIHGVRDNAAFQISAGATTLAEQLQAAGYDSGAFVGSFVLHSRWGLNRGFVHYDDAFLYGQPGSIPGQVERRAEAVVDAALGWLQEPRDAPFFAWIHLYDPHSPYSAPEPYGGRFGDRPYDGEVAYTDAQVGRLLDELEAAGLLENTIVVVTADHGEGLGDHGEPGHGMFLYDTTLLVPLIIRLPDQLFAGREVAEQVRLIDVAPTILELAGVALPEAFLGQSLMPFLVGESSPRPAYSETFYPRWHFGWQELHALRKDGFKYILAPRPELYDLRSDPSESTDVVDEEPERADELRAEVEELRDQGVTSGPGRLDADATQRLRALGYIGSAPADLPEGPLPDPKDKIGLFTSVSNAQGMLAAGDYSGAARLLGEVLEEDPRIVSAHVTRGNALFRLGDFAGALEAFEAALELNPEGNVALLNLGIAHRRVGDLETARADFEVLLSLDPSNTSALFNLGEMALEAGDPATARQHFEAAAEINDQLPEPLFGFGVAAFQLGQIDRAKAEFERVLAVASFFPEVHYYRGLIAESRGNSAAAAESYRAEVEQNPRHHRSWINLSQIHAGAGDHAAAVETLRSAIEILPNLASAHVLLARSLLALDDPALYSEVEQAARDGLSLDPPPELRPLAHYVLADVYNRLGRPQDVERELALAREAERAIRR